MAQNLLHSLRTTELLSDAKIEPAIPDPMPELPEPDVKVSSCRSDAPLPSLPRSLRDDRGIFDRIEHFHQSAFRTMFSPERTDDAGPFVSASASFEQGAHARQVSPGVRIGTGIGVCDDIFRPCDIKLDRAIRMRLLQRLRNTCRA